MVKCSAPLCGNSSYRKSPEITFHRFPKDKNLKNAWLLNMNEENWQPKSSSVLCSKHFEAHLLDHSGIHTVLTSSAIPTLFDSSFQGNISTSSLKGLVKRKAAGDQVLMDNPNVVQFKSAYKKNIIRLKLKIHNDGFIIPNPILTVSSSNKPIDTVLVLKKM